MDDVLQALSETVREANTAGRALRIRGGGTKDFYGGPLHGEPLDVRPYRGIVDYEPTELVITARAGTPLEEIEDAMRAHGQMLAFEPPHFDRLPSPLTAEGAGSIERLMPEKKRATLGGCVAAGLSGPRRMYAGAVRDLVLGVRLLDGEGRDLRFGGQVMKNVAGFDVSRVIAGSLGTLGVVLEASLKAIPLPPAELTVQLEMAEPSAIEALNRWAGLPLPITATAYCEGQLYVRLSGAVPAVKSAQAKLGGAALGADAAQALWTGLREHTHPYFAEQLPLWRLSLPSATAPMNLPGATLIEWSGALRWLKSSAAPGVVRDAVARAGGHATLFRHGDKAVGVFQPLSPALLTLHRRLKNALDPAGIFNRGRLYPDF